MQAGRQASSAWLEYSWLQVPPFISLNTSHHSILALRVSAEKSADRLMGVSLPIICGFSYTTFNIFFTFNFCHFNYSVSWCGLFWVDPVWDSLCFLNLFVCFLSHVREVFGYYVFKDVFCSFLSSSGIFIEMLVCLMLSQRPLKLFSFLFFFFFFSLFSFSIPTTLSSSLLIHSSVPSTLIPSSVLFISIILHQFLLYIFSLLKTSHLTVLIQSSP